MKIYGSYETDSNRDKARFYIIVAGGFLHRISIAKGLAILYIGTRLKIILSQTLMHIQVSIQGSYPMYYKIKFNSIQLA